jgi:hypothetical protein
MKRFTAQVTINRCIDQSQFQTGGVWTQSSQKGVRFNVKSCEFRIVKEEFYSSPLPVSQTLNIS